MHWRGKGGGTQTPGRCKGGGSAMYACCPGGDTAKLAYASRLFLYYSSIAPPVGGLFGIRPLRLRPMHPFWSRRDSGSPTVFPPSPGLGWTVNEPEAIRTNGRGEGKGENSPKEDFAQTFNNQQPTSNAQWARRWAVIGCWAFDIGYWMFPEFMERGPNTSVRLRSSGVTFPPGAERPRALSST